ncbi:MULTISPECIES: SLC13 family permease [Shouchella]|uniref:Sodium-dependent dicarboxylate transporter SdcS n=2 Tax=Shouchella TaxID=2893057 RepID=A0ABY7W8G5_9BACI|nr:MULTISPECIES: SLC13 family permease [Shouchella]MED4127765.1 SLC13 family permease [Shouchella miscanthi]WDF05227.1 SLC13 family permease [Shouchella hunanensis]
MKLTWNRLWEQSERTKDLLNIFSYANKSSAALKKEAVEHKEKQQKKTVNPDGGNDKKPYSRAQLVGLLLGPLLFVLTIVFFEPAGLSGDGQRVLAVTLWIATWWMTEAIPIPATSLMPLILLPMTGAMQGSDVASSYGNDIIFLFLGGFFIATAMEKWNLHKRIALFIISVIGTSTQRILLGFMTATAFLSFWVSNTAAVMMMIPMALAITAQVTEAMKNDPRKKDIPKFEKAIIFGVGYAGTIGGLGTLIGTPPNIILVAQLNELFGMSIGFGSWMLFSVPMVALLILFTWFYLGRLSFRTSIKTLPGGKALIAEERQKLGSTSFEERIVGMVFLFAAFMWISREFLWAGDDAIIVQLPGISDGMIAVIAAMLLFLIPAKATPRVLDWADSKDIPWGVLLLFGGGLAIAAGFQSSGLSNWLGDQLTVLDGLHMLLIIGGATLLIMMLTEITSNTATATMILPVVAALAVALDIHPFALMIPCAMAANCAFMLPVGTPPNAIIFGTGKLKIIEMVRAGFWLNVFATIIIVLSVYYIVPHALNVDFSTFPTEILD